MMALSGFIEFNIVADSADASVLEHRGSFRAEQVVSFVDVSSAPHQGKAKTRITLAEPDDYVNDDEEGGVVRGQRTVFVVEPYDDVVALIREAKGAARI